MNFDHFQKETLMRILIAEDDNTSRKVLFTVLKKGGYDVVETVNGVEAWNKLQQSNAPPLVILDWMMPDLDGMEVLRLVRSLQTNRQPYIIMLTAKHEKTDIAAALEAGANDYLIKPFSIIELQARVKVGRRMIEMQGALASKIEELNRALEEIKTLRGILPICTNCKKIRDDRGYWNQVEVYVHERTEAEFSHGICPQCMKKLYPEFMQGNSENEV